MNKFMNEQMRADCRISLTAVPSLVNALKNKNIAIVGGTGFVGAWVAETVMALNDEHGCGVRLFIYSRNAKDFRRVSSRFGRNDIEVANLDARSPFNFDPDINFVINAVGIADPRVAVLEPQRVFETIVYGANNSLNAAARLENLHRFVNISSGLVSGTITSGGSPLAEDAMGVLDFRRFHNIYIEARRAAESIAVGHMNQTRIPLSTARAFTFIGPYQDSDTPWAVNNFLRDAASGRDIRLKGDGTPKRSYLYGSDVAAWLLKIAVSGANGEAYNVGGAEGVSHAELAAMVSELTGRRSKVLYSPNAKEDSRSSDFYPDLEKVRTELGLRVTMPTHIALERTMLWLGHKGVGAS